QRCQKLLVEFSDRSRVAKQNIFNLEFNDRDFDLTLCFRLLHHFEDRTTQVQLVRELCRVTDRYVMISYFSTYSVTALRRRLRKFFRNKPVKQNPTPLNELVRMFTDQGFVLKKKIKRSGFVHSLQLAVFERIQTS
ncbi:MAG: class I SAM-dependent methyltransferase, partial [Pseudohongiellaceae bacterium]